MGGLCYYIGMSEFDYNHANLADKLLLIGELEHIYRHAKRSAQSSENDVFFHVVAGRAKTIRRKVMSELNFPDELHCLCKASASLRQLSYEIDEGDTDLIKEIDELVDMIWTEATGEDLSDCKACKEDKDLSDIDIESQQ